MPTCDECGEHENLPYQCNRCGETFCGDHRLPENHNCPGLNEWDDPSGVFDSGFDDSVRNRGDGSDAGIVPEVDLSRLTDTGGLLAYFRGNVSYAVLGVMWITFGLQYLVFPFLLGASPRTDLWQAVFVLSPGNVGYVWTWVTSIFAHGGFTHIAFNSIALYFFGPVVERYLDTRRFTALFFGAGIVAGLAQVASTLLTTGPFGPGVVGASGAIMGVLGVLTVLNPGLRVYLYFIIPMPLWVLTFGFAGFSIVAGLGSLGGGLAGGNVAHLAHLAGLLIGLVYGVRVKGRVGVPDSLEFGRGGGGMGGPVARAARAAPAAVPERMEPVRPEFVPDPDATRETMESLQSDVAAAAAWRDEFGFAIEAVDSDEQSTLGDTADVPDAGTPLVAGVDQAFLDDRAVSAVVVARGGEVVERAHAVTDLSIPYVPGLLAFREGGPILAAFDELDADPDLVVFDGSGRIHFRQAGLATHVGVTLDVPSVGVAKGLLCGTPDDDPDGRPEGWRTPIRAGADVENAEPGTVIGHVVQSRQYDARPIVNPLYVSPGHRVSVGTAADLVERLCEGYKLPEPTRRADAYADDVKSRLSDGGSASV